MVNLSALETEQKLLQPIHKMNNGATTRKQSSRTTILLFSPAATTTKTTLTTTTTRLQAARLPQSKDRLQAARLPRVEEQSVVVVVLHAVLEDLVCWCQCKGRILARQPRCPFPRTVARDSSLRLHLACERLPWSSDCCCGLRQRLISVQVELQDDLVSSC